MLSLRAQVFLVLSLGLLTIGQVHAADDAHRIVSFQSLNQEPEAHSIESPEDLTKFMELVTSTDGSNAVGHIDLGLHSTPQNNDILAEVSKDPATSDVPVVGFKYIDPSTTSEDSTTSPSWSMVQTAAATSMASLTTTVDPVPEIVIESNTPEPVMVTSTRTSTHTLPMKATDEAMTTVIIHTVHTLTVTQPYVSIESNTLSPILPSSSPIEASGSAPAPSPVPAMPPAPAAAESVLQPVVPPSITAPSPGDAPPSSQELVPVPLQDPILAFVLSVLPDVLPQPQQEQQQNPVSTSALPQAPAHFEVQPALAEALAPPSQLWSPAQVTASNSNGGLDVSVDGTPTSLVNIGQFLRSTQLGLPGDSNPAVEASGRIRDAFSRSDMERMLQDGFSKLRDELLNVKPNTTVTSPAPSQPSSEPDLPQERKSNNMDFGVVESPVPTSDVDQMLSEVLPDIAEDTRDAVRKVLNSILRIDDNNESNLPLKAAPEPVPENQQGDVLNSSASIGIQQNKQIPQTDPDDILPPVKQQSTVPERKKTGAEYLETSGLMDKEQSQVEKYFSLLNLGRLRGLPEDAVNDIFDFLGAKDKHQFIDDFRHRPFRKKIGLDITNIDQTSDQAQSDPGIIRFADDDKKTSNDLERDVSDVTDFDALEDQMNLYLAQNPIQLEKAPEDEDEDIGNEAFDLDDDTESVTDLDEEYEEDKGDTIEEDINVDGVEANGFLRNGLKKLTKKPKNDRLSDDVKADRLSLVKGSVNGYDTLADEQDRIAEPELLKSKVTSKFGKKAKLKKISQDGTRETFEYYDPERELFPSKDPKSNKKPKLSSADDDEIVSKNHNSKKDEVKGKSKKQKSTHLTEDSLVEVSSTDRTKSVGNNSTSSTHDRFVETVQGLGKKKNDEDEVRDVDLYLEKVKKNPSSLFTGSSGKGDGHHASTASNKLADHESATKDKSFFDFTSNAAITSRSYGIGIVIVALCMLVV